MTKTSLCACCDCFLSRSAATAAALLPNGGLTTNTPAAADLGRGGEKDDEVMGSAAAEAVCERYVGDRVSGGDVVRLDGEADERADDRESGDLGGDDPPPLLTE